MRFEVEGASAAVDPVAGGRLVSLVIGGRELLVEPSESPLESGCYPMVPFAGRIRGGRFTFDGVEYQVPINLESHAIHGYGYTTTWEQTGANSIGFDLADPWPFRGRVEQRFSLEPGVMILDMSLHAADRQPAMLGWHPWFKRDIGAAERLMVSFLPAQMYELDGVAIPTGMLVEAPVGPWDNCFTDLAADPQLVWGDNLVISLASSADHWVIYSEPGHAICVEPQTGAPDAVNRVPTVVEAGETFSLTFTLRW